MSNRIRPLTPDEAKRTLAHRYAPVADRYRQLYTNYGLRSRRVFLTWTIWSGRVRGEGVEEVLDRVELLPTPRISDLTSVARRPYSVGVFPEGTIRVDQISCAVYTEDMLRGREIPEEGYRKCCACGIVEPWQSKPVNAAGPHRYERPSNSRIDFWYELVEDGRGDAPPAHQRFRVYGGPSRLEGAMQWVVTLERADEPLSRENKPQIGNNAETQNADVDDDE